MPKNSRILQLEDDKIRARENVLYLKREGHTVKTVGTLYEFEQYLNKLPEIDVALIDNHVPWNIGDTPDYKPQGKTAEGWIRSYIGDRVIVIATTSDEDPDYGDYSFPPMEGSAELAEFVTKLPRKES